MIRVIKKDAIIKEEDEYVIPFLKIYYSKFNRDIYFLGIPEERNKRPDYLINTTNTLIEVKEIHDRGFVERRHKWAKITCKLQKSVNENKLISSVEGTFLIKTPELSRFPTQQNVFDVISDKILNAVIENKKTVEIRKFELEIKKISNHGNHVSFANYEGGFIDPANTIYLNIKNKIDKANIQLGNSLNNVIPSKRILLLVNKYDLTLYDWDLFKAIALSYKDLLSYENIDEIWYQVETEGREYNHKLLYKKAFFKQFENSKFKTVKSEELELFANWFHSLFELGEEERPKLLVALKYFLKNKKPDDIFPDIQTRIEIVRFGLWLADKELFDNLVWFIEKFINDSDPPDPKYYHGDEDFNYHSQILNNEDTHIITTVLGHLAWDIQKLVIREDYIIKSFEFTKQLLNHPNLYVKLEALVPLLEITARRQWLEEYDEKNSTHFYKEFKDIVFNLLKEYSQYKAIRNYLVHIFYYFKDLNTEESLEVLDKLKYSHEAAALFVYFGIFRERHYKGKVPFDSKPLKKKLNSMILNQDKEYEDLRGSIAWNFWHILKETPEEFSTIEPYLDLFFTLPYNIRYYSHLEQIIGDWIDQRPEVCISWFTSMLAKIHEYVDTHEGIERNIWISPEKNLKFIAIYKPLILSKLVEELVELWKLNVFIGSPKEIFGIYKLVNDPKLKKQLLRQFQVWYKEMKVLNPKLEEVDWK
ncbi:MAG: hypothetical protein ACYDAS_00100 [Patescibacteria group bacterium]